MARYIFVTGGVVSSLGKGLSSASLAYLLQSRGYKVRLRKLDPYLNVDPGTMSPFQHGEVYVTNDGAETDLDPLIIGNGGRFADVERSHLPNLAMESLGYATFLARTPQEDIRDYTVFLQGDPYQHLLHPGILDLALQSLNTGTYDVPFLHLNGMRFLSGGSICAEELREYLMVARAFPQTDFIDVEVLFYVLSKCACLKCETNFVTKL